MRWRYHELRGKHVRTRDERDLGRVWDMVAEPRDGGLCVIALLTGHAALMRRIGFKTLPLGMSPRRVPWRVVDRIEDDIYLSIDLKTLDALDAQAEPPDGRRTRTASHR